MMGTDDVMFGKVFMEPRGQPFDMAQGPLTVEGVPSFVEGSPWYLLIRPWGGILSESLDSPPRIVADRSGRVLIWPKDEPTAGGRGASRKIENCAVALTNLSSIRHTF